MEFQREPGRIYAMNADALAAEITFPDRNGAAEIDHTFVDELPAGPGRGGAAGPGGRGPDPRRGEAGESYLLLRQGLV